jgi:hypothetical protein
MMGKYVYVYTGGGMPESAEEGAKVMAAWNDWFGKLGSAVADIGNPFGQSAAVNGSASVKATGYSIVNAGSLDEALMMAKGCPILDRNGGNVEVYEAVDM